MPLVAFAEQIPGGSGVLPADVVVPQEPVGVVAFAHGTGSGRHSPRNRFVAGELNKARLATMLADLLTPEEERADLRTAALRVDIDLLGRRVVALADWIGGEDLLADLRVGLFGASTGAAAALVAAATRPDSVAAVVSRGGRPDLAGDALVAVTCPTLLIVGSRDGVVLQLNEAAAELIPGPVHLEVIRGASHLFEEPGALEQVAAMARDWFLGHLSAGGVGGGRTDLSRPQRRQPRPGSSETLPAPGR